MLGMVLGSGGEAAAADRSTRSATAKKAEGKAVVRSAKIASAKGVGKTASRSAGKASRSPKLARSQPGQGRIVKAVAVDRQMAVPGRMSIGQSIGLHDVDDPLDLRSAVALVVDQRTGDVLFSKNSQAVLPIASITKLMTALVVLDAQLPLSETLEISEADIDTEKGSRSRLAPGTRLTRGEMLQLALMSSENRAANALGRHFPGGLPAFVAAMNAKARALGMQDTTYAEPTGLSSRNVSNARDLSILVRAGLDYPLVRQFSTATELTVDTGRRMTTFRNTNRLIASPAWDIGLQKTGYISEAGSCLVMQVSIEGRPMVMVLLDAIGVRSRFGDAERLRHWIVKHPDRPVAIRASTSHPSLGS
ncbi:MAG: D-alanyl-D-alanine endopeptidase [Pseudomonadota bacterium]